MLSRKGRGSGHLRESCKIMPPNIGNLINPSNVVTPSIIPKNRNLMRFAFGRIWLNSVCHKIGLHLIWPWLRSARQGRFRIGSLAPFLSLSSQKGGHLNRTDSYFCPPLWMNTDCYKQTSESVPLSFPLVPYTELFSSLCIHIIRG